VCVVVPRVILRVRKAIKNLTMVEPEDPAVEGAAIEAEWQDMLARVAYAAREEERRLVRAEKALNRMSLH
jgi:hypothetical protein